MSATIQHHEQTPIEAQLQALREENARLKALASKPKASMGLKVTEKGGVSMYSLGRFPVTLYPKQWFALIERIDELKAFIAENAQQLEDNAAKQKEA